MTRARLFTKDEENERPRRYKPLESLGRTRPRDVLGCLRRDWSTQNAGHTLCVVPQNLYEFWVVCTRPLANNGLGKSVAEAAAEVAKLKTIFTLLDDTPAVFPTWEQLVSTHAVLGKNAHDARLVAAMLVHGVTHLLTFNDADFRRFTAITVLIPTSVLAPPSPPAPPIVP
jgi:predicted nucleic acid-binding protein